MSDKCKLDLSEKFNELSSAERDEIFTFIDDEIASAKATGRDPFQHLEDLFKQRKVEIEQTRAQALATRDTSKATAERFFAIPAFKGKADEAIEAMLHFLPGKKYKSDLNLFEAKTANMNTKFAPVMQAINKNGLMKAVRDGSIDEQLIKAGWGITDGVDSRVQKVVEAMRKMFDLDLLDKRTMGFNVGKIHNYMGPRKHNPNAMLDLGEEAWKDLAAEAFDFDKMGYDDIAARDYLDVVWRKRTDSAGADWWDDAFTAEFKEIVKAPSKKKIESSRNILFKTPEAEFKYYKAMNPDKNYMQTVFENMLQESGNVEAARQLGPNHRQGFRNMLNMASKLNPERMTAQRKQQLMDMYQTAVSGVMNQPNTRLGHAVKRIRQVIDMALLPNAILSTLPDFSYGTNIVSNATGRNYFGTILDLSVNTFKNLNTKQRAEAAELTGAFVEDFFLFQSQNRFDISGPTGGMFDKVHHKWMQLTGLPLQATTFKTTEAQAILRGISKSKDLAFDKIDSGMREMMEATGITAKDWEQLRKAHSKVYDGQDLININRIYDLPISKKRQRELAVKLSGFLSMWPKRGSPTPGLKQATLRTTYNINTPVGAALQLGMQYKAFILSAVPSAQSMWNYGSKTNFAFTVGTSLGLGFLSIAMKQWAKGKEAPDPNDPETWFRVAQQTGMGGLYGDILTTNYNNYGRSLPADLAGPTAALAGDVVELYSGFVRGELTDEKLKRKLERVTPGVIPIIGPRMRKATWDWIFETLNK